MRRIAVLLALGLAGPAPAAVLAAADVDGPRRGAFLVNGAGARPVGMGEAFTALADDASAVSWNPGGLAALAGPTGSASHQIVGEGIGISHVTGAMPVGVGVAGAAVTLLSFGRYDARDQFGDLTGVGSATDVAAALAWGVRHPGWLRVPGSIGVTAEVVKESVGGALAGFGAGGLVPVFDRLTLGWAAQHLGPPQSGFALPATLKAGAAYAWPGRAAAALDAVYRFAGSRLHVAAGGEVLLQRRFSLRLGYTWRGAEGGIEGLTGLAAGAGIRFGRLGFDYAFQPFGDLATVHRMSVVWGPPARSAAPEAQAASAVAAASPARAAASEAQDAYANALRFYQSGDPAGAEAWAAVAVHDGGTWQAWQLLGTCRSGRADVAGAVIAYRRSLALNAGNAALEAWVVAALAREASAAQAVEAGAAYARGVAAYQAGDHAGAIREAGEAVKWAPRHWQAWQVMGSAAYAQGDAATAATCFRITLELNPDNPAIRAFLDSIAPR